MFGSHPFMCHIDKFEIYPKSISFLIIENESVSSKPNLPAYVFWNYVPNFEEEGFFAKISCIVSFPVIYQLTSVH